ncbi:MAG TPA: hypothetical protein VGC95_07900 [Chitinophagaceae bacterium]
MKSILKYALIGLLAVSSTAYAGNKHKKNKKAQTTCSASCQQSCAPTCPKAGCCH